MKISTLSTVVSSFRNLESGLEQLRVDVERACGRAGVPLRLAVTGMVGDKWNCEIESVQFEKGDSPLAAMPSIFGFRRRKWPRAHAFNAVMLVPTGIDCAIGGHAGDATPAARLLASVCDNLIIHPNVVNASDINEQTDNCLYVEGSLICRLLMGTVALRKVRANRILVVTEAREDDSWVVDQVVNSTSAARATLGADCRKVVVLKQPLSMTMSSSQSGRAIGEISGLEALLAMLQKERENYDAVALSTQITPSSDVCDMFQKYFSGDGPNPWGGVEAALTHMVSAAFDVPSAHAPTLENMALRTYAFGRVDPRKSAEAISTSYMFCLLKGLHNAPALITDPDGVYDPSLISAEDVSCLIVPDGCIGLPTLAALAQDIPVIAVGENTNLTKNDLTRLPFSPGQLWMTNNYLEAAGLIAAFRAGIQPESIRRPLKPTSVEDF